MRQPSFTVVAVALAVLLAGAAAVYAYDSSRDDLIAKGVTVGGIDVGGMRAEQARRVLRRRLAARYSRPVVVRYGHHRFKLSPSQARIRTDVPAMVQEAVRASRDGNVLSRTWRGVFGGEVHDDLPTELTYSRAAVRGLVHRVASALDRPARDATVSFSGAEPQKVHSRIGVLVRQGMLAQGVRHALVTPGGSRVVRVQTRITEPKVTADQLPRRWPKLIVVDRNARQLKFYKRLKLARTYSIAVGQQGLETPAGLYHIQDKQVNPSWHVPNSSWAGDLAGRVIPPGPQDPLKARWMGFNGGAGIHGTADVASLGTAASHGCIRMSIPDVVQLYDKVQVGAPIYIA